ETAELVEPFSFTKGCRVLKMKYFGRPKQIGLIDPHAQGTMLFDLRFDPAQEKPLDDKKAERYMIDRLVALMKWNDAPPDQYHRLGLESMA
ncbi:MAG: sulfatase, partial [Planctomycetes bacterium]|nr:sulfatase [Planctomycetota bacterium]